MATTLNTLKDNEGARKSRTRVGRGIGSGKGKTCGRGMKGQKSRSGVAINGFEGGQMPIYRRLPKRGFNNTRRTEFQAVNIGRIQDFIDRKKLDAGKTITPQLLLESGVVTTLANPLKLLGKGELKSKVTIEIHGASASATTIVEKAGGKISLIELKSAPSDSSVKEESKKATKDKSSSDKKSEAA